MNKFAGIAGLTLAGFLFASQVNAADSPYTVVKSSDLIGKQVKNSSGTALGKVEDYVINVKTGKLVYGVILYGDTVGFGGKMFAVPPQALSLAQDQKFVLFDAEKDDLEKAAGFDANKWPTGPDERWARKGSKDEPKKDDIKKDDAKKDDIKKDDAKKDDIKKDDAKKDDSKGDDQAAHLRRVSSLIGTPVKNERGEDLGSIYGIVFDMKDNKVVYAAMSYGGVAGIGSKYFAIAWDAMKFESPTLKAGDRAFLINATKEELDKAPGFDGKTWPTEADKSFSKSKTNDTKPVKP